MAKSIRLSDHSILSASKRGAHIDEIQRTILESEWEPARSYRCSARKVFPFNSISPVNGKRYRTKTVEVVFKDEPDEIVVVTVKVYYGDEVKQ